MKQIVLEVISHVLININGTKLEKYKLKLLESNAVFITDGFSASGTPIIQVGDVIEYMEVIDKLSDAQMCEVFYKVKDIEKAYKREIEKATKIRGKEEQQKGIWLPCNFGDELTIDGRKGEFRQISYPFSYLKTYTYSLYGKDGKITKSFNVLLV